MLRYTDRGRRGAWGLDVRYFLNKQYRPKGKATQDFEPIHSSEADYGDPPEAQLVCLIPTVTEKSFPRFSVPLKRIANEPQTVPFPWFTLQRNHYFIEDRFSGFPISQNNPEMMLGMLVKLWIF